MGAKVSTGGNTKRGGYSETAEPNIIPFVDVMLVLLIIFMVAAPVATVDIQASLPGAKVLPSKRPPKQSYITVQDRGGAPVYYIGNHQVQQDQIGQELLKEVPKNAPQAKTLEDVVSERVYIRADATTAYRNVVYVMNRIQDEGFYKVALVAEDKRR